MKFRTKILLGGKTATGIEVPSRVMEGLGAGKKPPVRVTIKGYTYRSTVATVSANRWWASAKRSATARE